MILKKNEISEELKNAGYDDTNDLTFRMELTYYENETLLDAKNFVPKSTGYTFVPRVYGTIDNISLLKSLHPD